MYVCKIASQKRLVPYADNEAQKLMAYMKGGEQSIEMNTSYTLYMVHLKISDAIHRVGLNMYLRVCNVFPVNP